MAVQTGAAVNPPKPSKLKSALVFVPPKRKRQRSGLAGNDQRLKDFTTMISIEGRTQFARAEQKAREVKPHVSMVEFGTYRVASSQAGHDPYTVRFSKDRAGHWQGECTCKAHTKSKKPLPCFHLVSAYQAHKIQVGIRQQVRASQEAQEAPEPVAWCECGKPAFAHFDGSWWCIQCITEKAQAQEETTTAPDTNGGIVVAGVVTTSSQEIDRLIEQANEEALDRDHDDIFGFVPTRRERIKEEW